EPFGALAYHYGNRRLVFLRHPDVVRVVKSLAGHASLRDDDREDGPCRTHVSCPRRP
ncbi:MAG: mycofactocin biosynthesis chaperone MftB, partial [Actinomycetota bacterium]